MGCNNCPRSCNVTRENNEKGFCHAGKNAVIGRAAPHLWEEPCICGKNGSGAVFFCGCNLSCIYCQNSKISRGEYGREYTDSALADIYLSLQEKGVSNINFVTPTPYIQNIKRSLELAWERGLYLPTVYNCGGYESVSALKELHGYIGVYLPDFKYMSNELAKKYSNAEDYPERAKAALYEMVNQRGDPHYGSDGIMTKGVIVRHLVLPSHTDDSMKILDYLHKEYGDSIVISIMSQYTPMPNMKNELARPLTKEEYESVVSFAKEIGIKNAYIQDGKSAKSSFIPEFGIS